MFYKICFIIQSFLQILNSDYEEMYLFIIYYNSLQLLFYSIVVFNFNINNLMSIQYISTICSNKRFE